MKKIVTMMALAGLAGAAQAQTASIKYEVFDGSAWVSTVNVLPGASVDVRMVISWDGNAFGLADALASIRINGSGANTDSATITGTGYGRVAPFNFGAQNLATYTNVTNRLRIDVANDANDSTGGQISIFQSAPTSAGTNFNSGKSVTVFQFRYNLNAANLALRTLDVSTGNLRNNRVRLYASGQSSGPDVNVTLSAAEVTGTKGFINVIPTPGSLALLGLAGIASGRRRR
jgi:hypothetical protein